MPSTPKEESTMKYLKDSLKNKKKAKAMHANMNLINPEAVMHGLSGSHYAKLSSFGKGKNNLSK